jgi:hypothetical protein
LVYERTLHNSIECLGDNTELLPWTVNPFTFFGEKACTEIVFTFNVFSLYYCRHRQSGFNSVCEVFLSCGVLIGVAEDPSLLGCDALVLGA